MLRLTARRLLSDLRPAPGGLHCPVMVEEVTDWFAPQPGQTIADLTYGAGGHSQALLSRCEALTLLAVDRDEAAYLRAVSQSESLAPPSRMVALQARFSEAAGAVSRALGRTGLDGVLMDLGPSSAQLDSPRRGFALSTDGPLDMRMDPPHENPVTAAAVVNSLDVRDLTRIFKLYGEEKNAKRIANSIVDRRFAIGPLKTTCELAGIVETVVGQAPRTDAVGRPSHVATRVFQALRIFVNNELNELQCGLAAAHHLLRPGGLCAVISFHSLEDRIVKQEFQGEFGRSWEKIGHGVQTPSLPEVTRNPRARSAKMRLARKIAP